MIVDELGWKTLFVVLWVVFGLVKVPHSLKYRRSHISLSKHTAREIALLGLVGVGLVILPLIWAFTPWFDHYIMVLPEWSRWAGVSLAVLSIGMAWWAHTTLGVHWSPILQLRKDHKLVKTGPYKYMRHPMYAQIWLWVIAQWLMMANWMGFIGVITWAVLYVIRTPAEEQMLIEEFGDAYKAYIKTTGRILPKLF